jgi:hypothetical protein
MTRLLVYAVTILVTIILECPSTWKHCCKAVCYYTVGYISCLPHLLITACSLVLDLILGSFVPMAWQAPGCTTLACMWVGRPSSFLKGTQ